MTNRLVRRIQAEVTGPMMQNAFVPNHLVFLFIFVSKVFLSFKPNELHYILHDKIYNQSVLLG